MFWSLAQARVVISDWKEDYNHRRRRSAPGSRPQRSTIASSDGVDADAADSDDLSTRRLSSALAIGGA
jgi:hypothetical protein